MPFEVAGDQAEGLRRMLARSAARVVTVASARAGMGATSTVVNLAATLALAGHDVLVLDENLSSGNVANTLGLKPRYDLLNAVRGDKSLGDVILQSPQGVKVLPAARAIAALPQLMKPELARMQASLAQVSRNVDVVLVDTAAGEACSVSAGLAPGQALVVVLNATAAAITESYALIKRLTAEGGRNRFEIVVNKARNEAEARKIFGNIALVAHRHLRAHVEYSGYIPLDGKLKHATQLRRPVVEAYPAAVATEAFSGLASRLMASGGGREAQGLSGIMHRLMRQARSTNLAYAN